MAQSSPRMLGGRYEVRSLIGRGGMAQVHLGRDTRLSRLVAIKMLRVDLARDAVFQTRFRREAQAAASLNHPNIVAVYDTGEEPVQGADGKTVMVPYIVMEYVEGHTVKELLSDETPVPIPEAVEITQGVLAALSYSHAAGLVHRDIKPGNVMLTNSGKVKVMDFGIARAIADSQATMTSANAVVGTALYLSPEQARGEKLDERSDVYSAGCVLFELLTGRPPFSGDTAVSLAYQHVSEPPPLPSSIASDVPIELDQVTMKALAKDPAQRYSSAGDMSADLMRAAQGLPITAPPIAAWETTTATATTAAMTQVLPGGGTPETALGQTQVATYSGPTRSNVASTQQSTTTGSLPVQAKKKSKSWVWVVLLVLLAVALVGGAIWVFVRDSNPDVGMTTVPPGLIGMDQAEARAAIEDADLVFELVDKVASSDVEEGLVAEVTPESGVEIEIGGTVQVALSDGPGSVEVPDLTNLTQAEAEAQLTADGFVLGQVTLENDPDFDKGRVIRSSPQKGSLQKKGAEITLFVATGDVEVPPIQGMSQADAEAKLASIGLRSSVTEQYSSQWPAGSVLDFAPTGIQSKGTTINLVVSKGPEPAPPQSG